MSKAQSQVCCVLLARTKADMLYLFAFLYWGLHRALSRIMLPPNADWADRLRTRLLFLYSLGNRCCRWLLGKIHFCPVHSTSVSHTATFLALRDIRKQIVDKLSRMPMGTLLNTPSGQIKDTLVDRVEGLETPLAHLLPEMSAMYWCRFLLLFICSYWIGAWL